MNTSIDVQVLQWFERALAQKPGLRREWLAGQAMEDAVRERVLRLLDADREAGAFLEETAVAPEAAPPDFPKVGERLGAWELLKPIEAGGMGVVYLGRRADDVYDQQVAIKLVRPVHLLAAADFRRQLISRFEDERSILARMSHPNVARILDGGSTGSGIPYLVMEFVDGVPLTDFCKARQLDVNERLALFCKVCDGVQEAHRHLIVHRDLKPDNILVGENGEPRLLDFGIAKILEQEPLATDGKRHTSLSAMTPAYASPEQVRQQALTTSSDVYSLGVMLYQLLAGVRPYELGGLRPSEAEHVVCETLPEPMRRMLERAVLSDAERRQRRAQITADVERIVAKAMHKESPRRYGSAQELADDIRRYLDGRPVLAHPDSTAYRVGKFVRRNRWGVMAASVALAAVLASAGVAAWQARVARQAAADTEQVNEFLLGVLEQSDPYNAGRELSLGEAVDLASAQVAQRFGDRPDLSSRIRFALGYSMTSRNQLDLAERELDLAHEEALRAFGPDHVQTLRVLEGLAVLRMWQGQGAEAEAGWKDLVGRMQALGLQGDPLYAIALNNLGNYYLSNEDYPRAEEVFARLRDVPAVALDAGFSPSDKAAMLSNYAYSAHGLGELERAEPMYLESIRQLEQVAPDGSPELATALNNLGHLYQEQGDMGRALPLFERSVRMRERAFPRGHEIIVAPMSGLAMVMARAGQVAQALPWAEKASEMATRVYDRPERGAAFAHWVLAGVRHKLGDAAGAADALLLAQQAFAAIDPPPDDLAQAIPALREQVCAAPAAAAKPACAP